VQESGDFSSFVGYERLLLILPSTAALPTTNAAVTLTHAEGGSTRSVELPPLTVHRFDGGLATHCAVREPCRDLNIMARHGVPVTAETLRCGGAREVSMTGGGANALYVASGSVVVAVAGEQEQVLGEGDCLLWESALGTAPITVVLRPAGAPSLEGCGVVWVCVGECAVPNTA
jgi:environmental stress-induced protein Ves